MRVLGQFFNAEDSLQKDNFEISIDLYNSEIHFGLTFHDSAHASRRLEYPWVIQNVKSIRGNILDAGCGETVIGLWLASRGHNVTVVDNYMPTINRLNSITERYGIKRYKAEYGDITKLPYANDAFEVSYSVSVIEHLPIENIIPTINELIRVTRKRILITLDIPLESPGGFDFSVLTSFMNQFGITVIPPLTIFSIDHKHLGVYGMIFEKE